MMGLMLHTKGKSLIEMEMYSDAIEVLAMAEVSCYCRESVFLSISYFFFSKYVFMVGVVLQQLPDLFVCFIGIVLAL